MSDELTIQGDLAETTVPDLFRSLIRSSETAILTLEPGTGSDAIYFSNGRIVFASSSDPDMGLAETLLRGGELNLKQYEVAMDRLVTSRRMGTLLVELGYLKTEELMRAIERQASAIVQNSVSYRRGAYTISFTSEFPDGIIALQLNTDRLILDGVHRIDYWSLVSRGIGRFDRLVRAGAGAEARGYQLELSEEEMHVLSLLDTPQTVDNLCARSYLTNFVTLRTLWGMLAVNLVEDAESSAVDERRAAEAAEYELEDMVERYNSVYQSIFSLVFQKVGDHVYDFMDRVVIHLSPEVLPQLSGMNLVNEGRVDIDQLLNNLAASGSSNRLEIVQNVLNELLYGWIVEVKTEFGGELEEQAIACTDPLRHMK